MRRVDPVHVVGGSGHPTDLPKVVPCLPGAHLDEVVDGEYRGGLSGEIGPITAKYQGSARFLELDEVARRAVIAARGREERGSGSATATVTASLTPDAGGTTVTVVTDLTISGRAAQFGRGLLGEVSASLIGEFVRRLETMVHCEQPAPEVPAAPVSENTLDVTATVVVPLLRRFAVPAIAALAGTVVGVLLGRRSALHCGR